MHYHIRWSETNLDWEAFTTRAEAEALARELARAGEEFTIEEFDRNCPRCANGFRSQQPPFRKSRSVNSY
ncbi:MAG TPA: hypothetical protein VFB23_03600 [Candidatus Acidoferrales bacterium]|jgi:hypothetical protein|nr:hypothetical protein [Candidatus Acidoferrales bacterium]